MARSIRRFVVFIVALALVAGSLSGVTRAQEEPVGDPTTLADQTVALDAGDVVWQATELESLTADAPPIPFHRGFIVASSGPLLLLREADRFKRLAPGKAIAVTEGERVVPQAMAAAPVTLLAIELVDAADADDADSPTFPVAEGDATLSLRRYALSAEDGDEIAVADLLPEETSLPALIRVDAGEVELSGAPESDDDQGDPRTLAAGEWTSIAPDRTLTIADDVTLLVASLTALDDQSAFVSQDGASSGNGSTGAGSAGAPTAEPPTSDDAPAPAPEPSVLDDTPLRPEQPHVCFIDQDMDDLCDRYELQDWGTDPAKQDTDGDGLSDGVEVIDTGTDPTLRDTDGDGIDDSSEILLTSDPRNPDQDNDGVVDGDELDRDLNIFAPDSDYDGLTDGEELNIYGTDPAAADSDGDGLSDYDEIRAYGSDPTRFDTDDDCLNDGVEAAAGMSPISIDTDGDGAGDNAEYGNSDPLNPGDTPSGEIIRRCG